MGPGMFHFHTGLVSEPLRQVFWRLSGSWQRHANEVRLSRQGSRVADVGAQRPCGRAAKIIESSPGPWYMVSQLPSVDPCLIVALGLKKRYGRPPEMGR